MFGWFKSDDEKALERILAGCDDEVHLVTGVDGILRRNHKFVLRDVIRGLRAEGMSPTEIIGLIGEILMLIQAVGDLVGRIIDTIRENRKK